MLKFTIKRILNLIPILLGIALVSSGLYYIIPGDIVLVMLGQHVDPYTYINVKRSLGLDLPFWQNFLGFVRGLLDGNIGYSYIQQRPVAEIIAEALPVTFRLTAMALIITVAIGIPAGILAAVWDRKPMGQAINAGAVTGISLPSFLLALFLQLLFGVTLKWFPISGMSGGLSGYVLPGMAVGLPLAALYTRVARASMLEVLNEEYILYALSRGLSFRRVVLKHALPNAVIPLLTQLGMDFGAFMTGAVLTETIFNLPGMGRLVYSAINIRDFPVLRGILLLLALIVVAANLLVDLIYVKLDPRMASSIVRETDASM